ncbi:MAG: DinB family protein [Dehalococcoidia bacterium]
MDAKQLIQHTLLELEQDLERSLDGLTQGELTWRPSTEANSICFTFWHLTRAEDAWVNTRAQEQPDVFERDGWARKWDIPAQDTGFGYTPEQLAAFPNLPLGELWQYHRDARRQSLDYLQTLSPSDFDRPLRREHPRLKGLNIGRMFGHVICEIGQHVGHIRYLRGLQRGINK